MYTAIVEATFHASHRVKLPDGSLEPLHGHDWVVRAHFRTPDLDDKDMVVDFCTVQQALADVTAPLSGRNLNELPDFRGRTPTAELVARLVFDRLEGWGLRTLHRVEVTEAHGCVAAYERGGNPTSFDGNSPAAYG